MSGTLEPRTGAGRAMLAFWLDGRTHPPSTERLATFVAHILAIEAEANGLGAKNALRGVKEAQEVRATRPDPGRDEDGFRTVIMGDALPPWPVRWMARLFGVVLVR